MDRFDIGRRLVAEAAGTAFLVGTVVGSGIMAERLADGNVALALLGNTIPTGAILIVLITALGPVSGAHFNPAVTFAFLVRRDIGVYAACLYIVFQILGGLLGTWAAHVMFEETIFQYASNVRTGPAQWFAEVVAVPRLNLSRPRSTLRKAAKPAEPAGNLQPRQPPAQAAPAPPSSLTVETCRKPCRRRIATR